MLQDNNEGRIELHRKPIGVVGSITPWNWPLIIATWHIVPAIAVGNTVVNGLAILVLWSGGWPTRIRWRAWLLFAVAIILVAVVRIYGRRHWPSDTVGAAAIGCAYGVLAILVR